MAILNQRRALAIGTETTAGTPVTLTNSNTLYAWDSMIQGDIPQTERRAYGNIGNLASVPGPKKGKATFKLEYLGGGSGAPEPLWATTLLPACGFLGTTHVYKPTSLISNQKTLTLGVYETSGGTSAVFKTLYGATGTFKINGKSGEPCYFEFEFTGIWGPPTDVTNLSLPAFPAVPPTFVSSAFSLGTGTPFSPKISKFDFDMGNTSKLIESINTASGYLNSVITKRNPKGSIDPMAETVTAWDVYGEWYSGATQAMSLQVGSTAGNTMTITAPAFQIVDAQEANRDDLVTTDVKFQLNENTGDDEISIAFS